MAGEMGLLSKLPLQTVDHRHVCTSTSRKSRHVMPNRKRSFRCSADQEGGKLASDRSVRKTSQEDMQARLAKARQYKQSASAGSPRPSVAPPPISVVRPDVSATQSSQDGSGLETDLLVTPNVNPEAAVRQDGLSAFVVAERGDESNTAGAGAAQPNSAVPGSNKAAGFLRGLTTDGAVTQLTEEELKLSPEQITKLINERRRKNQQVEIITVDQGYQPTNEGDAAYKPKVATWGVFPRPNDISKAFGGGRTIRPGQELESKERQAERKARTAAALLKYKKDLQVDMSPEAEQAAIALFESGAALMSKGRLEVASDRFREATALAAPNSQLGGDCKMQLAICLDSMNRSDEAAVLYKQMTRHPQAYISKKAKQMIFGLNAMDYLKTKTISYSADTSAFQPYFTKLASDYSSGYKRPEGEVTDDTAIVVFITALIIAPLALVAGKILWR